MSVQIGAQASRFEAFQPIREEQESSAAASPAKADSLPSPGLEEPRPQLVDLGGGAPPAPAAEAAPQQAPTFRLLAGVDPAAAASSIAPPPAPAPAPDAAPAPPAVRPIDLEAPRDIFRDAKTGNALAYFEEVGGNVIYSPSQNALYRQDPDYHVSLIQADDPKLTPTQRQDIIAELSTPESSGAKVVHPTTGLDPKVPTPAERTVEKFSALHVYISSSPKKGETVPGASIAQPATLADAQRARDQLAALGITDAAVLSTGPTGNRRTQPQDPRAGNEPRPVEVELGFAAVDPKTDPKTTGQYVIGFTDSGGSPVYCTVADLLRAGAKGEGELLGVRLTGVPTQEVTRPDGRKEIPGGVRSLQATVGDVAEDRGRQSYLRLFEQTARELLPNPFALDDRSRAIVDKVGIEPAVQALMKYARSTSEGADLKFLDILKSTLQQGPRLMRTLVPAELDPAGAIKVDPKTLGSTERPPRPEEKALREGLVNDLLPYARARVEAFLAGNEEVPAMSAATAQAVRAAVAERGIDSVLSGVASLYRESLYFRGLEDQQLLADRLQFPAQAQSLTYVTLRLIGYDLAKPH
ncbi:MAG TPA: hypothetical protein VND93_02235 [Myxococcales bacterium]|nr:hypothetical protein [Myxococcales bacterium]